MAQKVTVQLVDDLDGTSADDVSTVLFGLDGVTYEIDLTEANADRLRGQLVDYVDASRRVGGRVKRGIRPLPTNGAARTGGSGAGDAKQIREWALANGMTLAGRGRIPAHVVEAYQQAASAPTAQASKPARSRRSPNGRARSQKS